MLSTRSRIVFACHSAACAPPPVGKGGSIKAQHVTERRNLSGIMREGFLASKHGSGAGQVHGAGFYFANQGDQRSERFYSSMTADPHIVKVRLNLKNPLKVQGGSMGELREEITKALGGEDEVVGTLQKFETRYRKAYREAAIRHLQPDNPEGYNRLWAKHKGDPLEGLLWDFSQPAYQAFQSELSDQFGKDHETNYRLARKVIRTPDTALRRARKGEYDYDSDVNHLLGHLVRQAGYDALVIEATSYDHHIGGSQILVFSPKSIRPTRPLP